MHRYLRVFVHCLLLSFLGTKADAQMRCKVEHYTTEDGLSHDRVTNVIKDSEGFMWIGSWDGINRFDGHNFVTYRSSPGDMSNLKNDRVDQLLDDRAGYLWLRGSDHQIYRFDKRTEQFAYLSDLIKEIGKQKLILRKTYSFNKGAVWVSTKERGVFFIPRTNMRSVNYYWFNKASTSSNLPSDSVTFVHQDKLQNVWVGTAAGIACLTKNNKGVYQNTFINQDLLQHLNFTDFCEDTGNLYFATSQGYLVTINKLYRQPILQKVSNSKLTTIRRSKKQNAVLCATIDGDLLTIDLTNFSIRKTRTVPGVSILSMYEDRSGNVWLEPNEKGVIRVNTTDHSFKYYTQRGDGNNNNGSRSFNIFEDVNGTIWVNLKGGGFGNYDAQHDRIDCFYDGTDATTHKFPGMVLGYYYDKAGIIWLCTDEGLDKVTLPNKEFSQNLLVLNATSKMDNLVRGIYNDRKDRLWVGTKGGNMYVLQNGKPINDLFVNRPKEGFGLVYTFAQSRNGTMWIGTKQNGLFKAEPLNKEETSYQLTHYTNNINDKNSLSSNDIYSIIEDNKEHIWIGTYEHGLNLAITKNHITTFYNQNNGFTAYPKDAFQKIRHLALDRSGNLWVGGTDGLIVMKITSGNVLNSKFAVYGKIQGDQNSLGDNDVQFIFRDARDQMWLCTSGGGLGMAMGNDPLKKISFRNYTKADGLPNDFLLSCTEDEQGNLWAATLNGFARLNKQRTKFRNYDSNDGLFKTSFSEASCTRSSTGELFFGTTNGYIRFDPQQISNDKIWANIAFTNLQVNNINVATGTKDGLLSKNINYVNDIKLKYDQNIISIDYAVLDQKTGAKQNLVYRLKGINEDWHNNNLQPRATYTNLPPGNYTFEVKSINDGLYINDPAKSLKITVASPPWLSWWAYLIYAVLIVTAIMVVIRIAFTILRLRQGIAVEKKMASLKVDFFTNISHELRTPLTLILNPIEQIAKKEVLTAQGHQYIEVVRKNADRMVRFMNQWLDLRKIQNGKGMLKVSCVEMVSFTKEISRYFDDIARQKNIDITISSDVDNMVAWIDAEKIDIVLYNLLSNAFKYTADGKSIIVNIELNKETACFSIRVSDEGIGLPDDKLASIFELYYVEDCEATRKNKGTGIGLALSKELVELHHGRIYATNNIAGGLTVTLQLKLGRAHFTKEQVLLTNQAEGHYEIAELINSTLQVSATDSVPTHQHANMPTVLLVEDNDELRTFLSIQLSEFYKVETAQNGQIGLEKAIQLLPDLIISDVMMPVMNGISLLDKIKKNDATSHIPVVLLSARSSVESQIEGLDHGADFYITKPFHSDLLLASVQNLIKQRKKIFNSLVNNNINTDSIPSETTITPRDEAFLKRVINTVELSMANPDLNIDMIANSMAMGRTSFYNKFKSLTGISAVEFVRDMRLKRAKQHLDNGETSISTIAYEVGFSDPKYFSTCFKEKYSVSPKEYLRTIEPRSINA